jgi:hypothetical protein
MSNKSDNLFECHSAPPYHLPNEISVFNLFPRKINLRIIKF